MTLTQEMQRALSNRARAANRRLERATPGQRAYLEKQIEKYHTRERAPGFNVFQQGKAQSEAEYRARMRELDTFMAAKTSTRKGWKSVKKAQVEAAGKTLREKQGYNLTDNELALILEEIDTGHGSADFYKALANVEINKAAAGDRWTPNAETISAALAERRSAQERAEMLIKARSEKKGS